jgi:soluble lytic murein transglycosylase
VLALALLGALGGGWYAVHRSMPAWYARLWFPLEYEAAIATEARRFDVEPALVAAVIYEESGFVPDSRSHRGAVGLMQVLPSTARFVASLRPRPSPAPDRLEEPGVNIAYGTSYLHYLMDRYGEIPLALAAYNAGEANVDGWVARAREEGQALRVPDDIPFGETRRYVREVLRTRDIYRRAYGDRLRG